jgi:transposase-like protein
MACCRFRRREDEIVTKEQESGHHETEVPPKVQDRGRQGGDGSWSGVAMAEDAHDLDLPGSVLRLGMRELVVTPAAAFPGNGQMRANLAETAALRKEVARLWVERDILKNATVGSTGQRNIFGLRCSERTQNGTNWSPWLVA